MAVPRRGITNILQGADTLAEQRTRHGLGPTSLTQAWPYPKRGITNILRAEPSLNETNKAWTGSNLLDAGMAVPHRGNHQHPAG